MDKVKRAVRRRMIKVGLLVFLIVIASCLLIAWDFHRIYERSLNNVLTEGIQYENSYNVEEGK